MSEFRNALLGVGISVCLLAVSAPLHAQEGFPGDKGRDEWNNDFVVYLWAVKVQRSARSRFERGHCL